MTTTKLIREINVQNKATNEIVAEIPLDISVETLISIFGHIEDDPLFYDGYQITEDKIYAFSYLFFNFSLYNYFVVCSRALTDKELEILTINRFFKKEKTKRYSQFVSNDKTRQKFIDTLPHTKDLDYSKFYKIDSGPHNVFLEKARECKVGTCYAISENNNLDRKHLDLKEAINETVGYGMGTLLVLGEAQALYYEGEEMNDRWISR